MSLRLPPLPNKRMVRAATNPVAEKEKNLMNRTSIVVTTSLGLLLVLSAGAARAQTVPSLDGSMYNNAGAGAANGVTPHPPQPTKPELTPVRKMSGGASEPTDPTLYNTSPSGQNSGLHPGVHS